MKAAPFDYFRPETIEEACQLLETPNRRVIAGGQTLVPMMAMRLARPEALIDIGRIEALAGISDDGDVVAIGACARQADVERSPVVRRRLPLLIKALRFVGHPQTRNRGTIGGSIANADPAAEIPLVALTLGAEVVIQDASGRRTETLDEFFLAPMVTSLGPADILAQVCFPVWNGGRAVGSSFQEISPRRSDFALAAVAVQLVRAADGTCARASLAAGGVGPTPLRSSAIPDLLAGRVIDEAAIRDAADAVDAEIEPEDDLHATAAYRRLATRTLVERALHEAWRDAAEEGTA